MLPTNRTRTTRSPARRAMRWTSRLAVAAVLAPVALTMAATHTPAPVTVRLLADAQAEAPQASRSWTRDDQLVATLKRASVSEPGGGTTLLRVAPGLDVPEPALRAYQFAEEVMRRADPTCHIDWSLLAAIGDVESDHGRYGGAEVRPDGTSTPRILGAQLDGAGDVAAISDTDDGAVDGDRRWDRAVGPMQFIPSTWELVGADADGDGVRDPHDVDDAALAAAVYLCAGDDDLSTTAGQQTAVYRYNHSASYVALVLRLAQAYADDAFTLSAPQPTVTRAAQPVDVPALRRPVEVGAHPAQPPSRALGFGGRGTTDDSAAAPSERRSRAQAGTDAQSSSHNGPAGGTSSRTATRGDGDTSDVNRASDTDTAGESTGDTDASGDSTTRTGEDADSADGSTSGSTSPSDGGDSTTSDNTGTTDGTTGGTASDGGEESGTTDGGDGSTDDDTTNGSGDGSTDDGATSGSQDGADAGDRSSPDASGTLARSDGNWFVGESPVDFGDKDYLAGEALHDFDGVDGIESNLGELETLIDHDVSVVLEGGLVQKLNDMEYR